MILNNNGKNGDKINLSNNSNGKNEIYKLIKTAI